MTSEIAMIASTWNSLRPCSTVSPIGEEMDALANKASCEGNVMTKNKTKRDDIWHFDLEDQSHSFSESLEGMRSMLNVFGDSITSQLKKMTKRMDELQKTTDDGKKDVEGKINCINQQLRQMNKRTYEVQKTT